MHTKRVTIKSSGATIPAIGIGTFGSDHIEAEVMAHAVKTALDIGYRNIDCASVYGNEREIGAVLKESTIARGELWVTSKVWNDSHGKANVIGSAKRTLLDLGLDYLDLYLVHWPFPNYHPPHCDVDSRSPDARPFILEEFMDTWAGMEALVKEGVVRHIGTSNMTRAKLELVLPHTTIRPSFNEMEVHPTFQQRDFVSYIKSEGMIPIGFSPLGSPNRPERDKTEADLVDMEDPIIVEIARAHHVHPAAICLKWAHQNGIIPIPLSTKERNLRSNYEAIHTDPLTEEELTRLKEVEANNRLIKGQVFLWEGATGWEDLWDEDGIIAR